MSFTSSLRSSVPALLTAVALLAGAGSARADQLEWVSRADAERAAAALTPGSLVVQWVSHMPDSRPVIYWVQSAEAKDVAGQDGFAEVKVRAVKVASAHTLKQPAGGAPYKFDLGAADGPAQELSLDLAYTYVCSSELPGVFVNLGKKLALDCQIRTPAIEVGVGTVEAITARVAAVTAATTSGGEVCEGEGANASSRPSRGIADRLGD
jgi:hypothetical protein